MKQTKIPIIDVKKYGGKQVAIVDGKIIAVGIDTGEVLARARKKLPRSRWDEIILYIVPKGITVGVRCPQSAWT